MRASEIARITLFAADVLLVGLALWIGYILRFDFEIGALETYSKAPADEYVKAAGLLAGTILLLCHGWGLFRMHSLRSSIEETAIIAKAVTLATGFVLALTFFYRQFTFSRLTFVYFWFVCILLLSTAHAVFRRWQLSRYKRGLDRRRVAIVGRSPSYLAQQLVSEAAFGLDVLGYVAPSPDREAPGPGADDAAAGELGAVRTSSLGTLVRSAQAKKAGTVGELVRLGHAMALGEVLDAHPIEEVLVVDQDLTHETLLHTLDACEKRGVKVLMIPPIYDLLVGPEDFTYVHNVPLIRVDERRYHRLTRFAKRVFDIAVSSSLLLVLWPFLALIALAIRLDSPGRALFVQVRAGAAGRPFGMYKFRTMVADAEGKLGEVVDLDALDEPVFKVVDDPRITRVGRFLRRWSLDELPQLWNVLRGDMSLVGPRPEELRVVDRYDVWQRRRLKVKPGITGLQQVEARGSLSDLNARVRLDVYYIRKQSVLFDVVILVRTVWAVLRGSGAS
jgi:exopolysaccharide biosynthesis polyprenyl glycosylphosphotransferase